MHDRRQFLSAAGAAAAAAMAARLGPAQSSNTAPGGDGGPHPLIVFAKPLQHLGFDELGRRLRSIGVQGIEATLRKGGQIEPEDFDGKLPRLVEALAKHEQRVIIAASDLIEATPETERQLKLFADLGIPYFRTAYFRYDFTRPLLPQLDVFAKQAAELAQLCQSLGIAALYQNHAGKNYVGAALWDLQRVLAEVDPRYLGVAFDIRHAALELSLSWEAAYAAIRPHIGAVYAKDFAWRENKPANVPLGDGVSRPVFQRLLRDGLVGPINVHVEYIDHRIPELQEQRWAAVAQDVATLRGWIGGGQ